MKIEQKDIVEMSFLEGQISMLEFFIPNLESLPNEKAKIELRDFLNLRKEKLKEIVKRNTEN
jgi:hypothetical protein